MSADPEPYDAPPAISPAMDEDWFGITAEAAPSAVEAAVHASLGTGPDIARQRDLPPVDDLREQMGI